MTTYKLHVPTCVKAILAFVFWALCYSIAEIL